MRLMYSNGVLSIEVAGRTRKIGEIKNRVLSVYRDQRQHYMRKHNGYGFSESVIRDGRLFDYILLEEWNGEYTDFYLVSREDVLAFGIVDEVDDFEKQIFIPLHVLKKINQYKDVK